MNTRLIFAVAVMQQACNHDDAEEVGLEEEGGKVCHVQRKCRDEHAGEKRRVEGF